MLPNVSLLRLSDDRRRHREWRPRRPPLLPPQQPLSTGTADISWGFLGGGVRQFKEVQLEDKAADSGKDCTKFVVQLLRITPKETGVPICYYANAKVADQRRINFSFKIVDEVDVAGMLEAANGGNAFWGVTGCERVLRSAMAAAVHAFLSECGRPKDCVQKIDYYDYLDPNFYYQRWMTEKDDDIKRLRAATKMEVFFKVYKKGFFLYRYYTKLGFVFPDLKDQDDLEKDIRFQAEMDWADYWIQDDPDPAKHYYAKKSDDWFRNNLDSLRHVSDKVEFHGDLIAMTAKRRDDFRIVESGPWTEFFIDKD